jgi:cyclase
VIAEIAKVTKLPITTVICSHANPDHTLGLPAYPKGVNIIMQQNAAKEIEDLTFYKTWTGGGGDRAGSDKAYLPTQTVDTRANLKVNGVNLVLLHWAPAHTSGDLVLYLPDQKIAFIGDLGGAGIHLENNGSSEGMIESIRGLLALDCDTYVRGHAAPGTKADLQKGLDDLVTRRSKIVGLYEDGKSLDEAEAAMGEKVNPQVKGMLPVLATFRAARDMNFTEIVYNEMSRR